MLIFVQHFSSIGIPAKDADSCLIVNFTISHNESLLMIEHKWDNKIPRIPVQSLLNYVPKQLF